MVMPPAGAICCAWVVSSMTAVSFLLTAVRLIRHAKRLLAKELPFRPGQKHQEALLPSVCELGRTALPHDFWGPERVADDYWQVKVLEKAPVGADPPAE